MNALAVPMLKYKLPHLATAISANKVAYFIESAMGVNHEAEKKQQIRGSGSDDRILNVLRGPRRFGGGLLPVKIQNHLVNRIFYFFLLFFQGFERNSPAAPEE